MGNGGSPSRFLQCTAKKRFAMVGDEVHVEL
jgi:hypothetical protein